MRYIFTKSFFRLSSVDQAAVVSAVINDLEKENYLTEEDQHRAYQQAERIRKKAVAFGVLLESEAANEQ